MNNASGRDPQLLAVWADQQAQELLLRAALKFAAARSPADRDALLARIDSEIGRFASATEDPAWRQSVLAVVQSLMDDVRGDLAA